MRSLQAWNGFLMRILSKTCFLGNWESPGEWVTIWMCTIGRPMDPTIVVMHTSCKLSEICWPESGWSSIVTGFQNQTIWDIVPQHPVNIVTPAFAEALVPEEVPEAQTGEAAYALSMRRKARASMAASANTSTKSLGIDRIPPKAEDRAQGAHSTPHGVGVARLDPPIGQTSRKCLADTSKEDIAGEATAAHSNMSHRQPQQLPQHVSVQDRHRPSPKVIGGNVVAEVRGVGEAAEEIARVDVVEEMEGRENHHPEARVLKTAPVHHAYNMRVLSSKMITGRCPKAEMWLLDITSTTEMSCSIHVAPSVHFQPACCLILEEQDMIKKIMRIHVSKTIGDSMTLTNPLTAGRGRQSFAWRANIK